MLARLRPRLTFANVCSFLALLIALGTGSAYAANTVFSSDIVDGQVKAQDLADNAITTQKIRNNGVKAPDLGADAVDGSKVFDASLGAADLGFASVESGEIATDAVNASEVAANAIDSDEIVDNSLTLFDLGTNSVNGPEITDGAVHTEDVGINEIQPGNVANNSLTGLDFAGGRSSGTITLNAGFVANGFCRDFGISVPNAEPGDAMIFGINTSVPHGIVFNGVRVSSSDVAIGKVCNLTGGPFPQLNDIQVAILTITL